MVINCKSKFTYKIIATNEQSLITILIVFLFKLKSNSIFSVITIYSQCNQMIEKSLNQLQCIQFTIWLDCNSNWMLATIFKLINFTHWLLYQNANDWYMSFHNLLKKSYHQNLWLNKMAIDLAKMERLMLMKIHINCASAHKHSWSIINNKIKLIIIKL